MAAEVIALQRLITTATHVLVLDAHLDNKTVDFMCNMAEESGRSKPLVRVNTSTPPPKKAFEIKSDKPHLRGQKAAYIAKLIQQLKAGKNVYLVTASKGFGEDVMRAVAKACPEIPEVSPESFLPAKPRSCTLRFYDKACFKSAGANPFLPC